jgi:AbrB family looped-hinge helix DNA binding protein
MQREAKITSKGQVTVPREVRQALGVKPGDKIVFEQNGKDVSVRPVVL